MDIRYIILPCLIAASLVAGYAGRKLGIVPPWVAKVFMTLVTVMGYPVIGLLSIWATPLTPRVIYLPVLAAVQMTLLGIIAIPIARRLTADRQEVGLLSLHSAINNSGLTMGGFVIYLLYGDSGLGLANIYAISFGPMVVLVGYSIAHHYVAGSAPALAVDGSAAGPSAATPLAQAPRLSLGRLLLKSIFDWRSAALPMSIAGVLLSPSVLAVPRPPQVSDWHIIDILMYWINFSAYFSIGLQLRLSFVRHIWRLIAALGVIRFALGLASAAGLIWLTWLTPAPLVGLAATVFLIESFTPCGVTCVAVATMFGLRPVHSSVLFVINTLMYLIFILPFVMWYFSCH